MKQTHHRLNFQPDLLRYRNRRGPGDNPHSSQHISVHLHAWKQKFLGQGKSAHSYRRKRKK